MRATWQVDEELHHSVWSRLRHTQWRTAPVWWVLPLLYLAFIVPPMAVSLLVGFALSIPSIRRKVNTSRLRETPSPVLQYEVEVWFYREGFLIGKDTGLISIVDRWLLFVGNETSFSLPSMRCRQAPSLKSIACACRPPSERMLGFETLGPEPIAVVIRSGPFRSLFDESLRSWLAGKEPLAGEPVEPPCVPHPRMSYEVAWEGLGAFAFGLCTVAGITMAIAHWSRWTRDGLPPLLLGIVVIAWCVGETIRHTASVWRWSMFLRQARAECPTHADVPIHAVIQDDKAENHLSA